MKHKVKKFKNLSVALKELELFVRNGEHLRTGRPFKKFDDMRSRECLANWLLCAAINSIYQERLTFTSAPIAVGGDGVIVDTVTGETWVTEHVSVATHPDDIINSDDLILEAISNKKNKGGVAYASGKTLVVFLASGLGEWFPNNIAKQLPASLTFEAVWIVGLHGVEDGEYTYNVTRLDLGSGDVPVWRIRIAKDFDSWIVSDVV